jgi:hypothetical protein
MLPPSLLVTVFGAPGLPTAAGPYLHSLCSPRQARRRHANSGPYFLRATTDADGPLIPDDVYETLFREEVFNLNVVSYALDDAVRGLRENKVEAQRWSVFVPMGA